MSETVSVSLEDRLLTRASPEKVSRRSSQVAFINRHVRRLERVFRYILDVPPSQPFSGHSLDRHQFLISLCITILTCPLDSDAWPRIGLP